MSGIDWKRIEDYDARKKKPKWAIFWFPAVPNDARPYDGRPAMIRPERIAGNRKPTHYAEITPPEGV